jgi:hypothetical protein
MSNIADDLAKCVLGATKKYTKQRKAEERDKRNIGDRQWMYVRRRVSYTSVAHRIFPEAYKHASGGGTHPVSKRQMYYAARDLFHGATGRAMKKQATCDSLLLRFMNAHPKLTATWRITADPRGTLLIPNTWQEMRIPCGTLDIDSHLHAINTESLCNVERLPSVPIEWPSVAPGQRYRAVVYIEKEGFEPLLRHARIAERFEIAVMSCKGQSVVAARKFVDHVCRIDGGVPLFVVHDFDLHGFCIGARLTSVSEQAEEQGRVAYRFRNEINVTDFGLRLADAQKYSLVDERCRKPEHIDADLGCTQEEKGFLLSGRRIELNAFSSPQFVEWLEGKLRDAGITERMIPDDNVLDAAYREALITARVNAAIRSVHPRAAEHARAARLPKKLADKVRASMAKRDEPWDLALQRIAAQQIKRDRGGN